MLLHIFIKMRKRYIAKADIPEGISGEISGDILKFKKDNEEVERMISIPGTSFKIDDNKAVFVCEKANKKSIAMINSAVSHVRNMLKGLEEKFVYKLEICHVHFPMTVKAEGDKVVINNFLGEKESREAPILSGVNVEIKGNEVTVSGTDIDKAGQTAANIEQAARVPKKDKRIFQDGIFMTEKPGGKI